MCFILQLCHIAIIAGKFKNTKITKLGKSHTSNLKLGLFYTNIGEDWKGVDFMMICDRRVTQGDFFMHLDDIWLAIVMGQCMEGKSEKFS